jgi:hypothetical protein
VLANKIVDADGGSGVGDVDTAAWCFCCFDNVSFHLIYKV